MELRRNRGVRWHSVEAITRSGPLRTVRFSLDHSLLAQHPDIPVNQLGWFHLAVNIASVVSGDNHDFLPFLAAREWSDEAFACALHAVIFSSSALLGSELRKTRRRVRKGTLVKDSQYFLRMWPA